ncbi:serine/threonine protein kinase, partial [Streptomyces umbrinus]
CRRQRPVSLGDALVVGLAVDDLQADATTSAQPGAGSGPTSPTSSADPTGAAESSASPGATGPFSSGSPSSASDVPSASASAPTEEATPPSGGTATPAPTTASPTAPAAPAVKDVAVSGFRQTGPTTGTTTVSVTTDGTGPISVTVSWYTGDTSGQLGTPDGTPQTFDRSGATQYTFTVDHTFQGKGCYWAVQATTAPASADGGASQQLLTRGCDIR